MRVWLAVTALLVAVVLAPWWVGAAAASLYLAAFIGRSAL